MQVHRPFFSTDAISDWLIEKLAEALAIAPEIIDIHRPFAEYGLDSLAAVGVTGELEEWMDMLIPATLLWDYPTTQAISHYLAAEHTQQRQPSLVLSA
jgi:acyl carrier protein